MKKLIKNVFSFLLMATIPISVPSAELPTLPAAQNITCGSLANGVKYYIVTNSSYKGMADIALVQKAGLNDETKGTRGTAAVNARGALSELPHFSDNSPFSYLRGKAVHPSDQGFVTVSRDASIYRFENLVQARKAEIIDSTLLLVFDIIGRDGGKMSQAYIPENQAIIVSGDIDAASIRSKMDMLSMLIAKKPGQQKKDEYQWHETEGPEVRTVLSWTRNSISAEYRYPRTGEGDMATVLPLVTSRYASELQILLRKRLETALGAEKIPYSGIDFSYKSSAERYGDELFRVTINTTSGNLEKATEILAETLASLDSFGASKDEFRDIENELNLTLQEKYGATVIENSHYVDKCISSFLYGASLATDKSNLEFFSGRNIDAETSTRLFNNFIFALLDKSRNLTLVCETRSDDGIAERIKNSFESSWGQNPKPSYNSFSADSTSLHKSAAKVKIRQITPEPLFGGEMWTFSNGIKVIYKKVENNGYFHYSWLIKGGFSSMQALGSGESAYIGDVLGTYRVAGMEGRKFREMLLSNGVTMNTEVSLSELGISGSAKASRIQLLMKALLSVAGDRAIDAEAYDYYRQCERLRVSSEMAIEAKLDSLMNRDNLYSEYKRPVKLADDLPERAAKYYDGLFSRANDGVLIIVGDIDEAPLKKVLLQYIGAFSTDRAYAYRFRNRKGVLTSRSTAWRWGSSPAVGVELSSPINYTAGNFMAANIAALTMEDAVASAVAPCGWTLHGEPDVRMFPEESLNLDLIMSKASVGGLPATLMSVDSSEVVLDKARRAIESLGKKGISAKELEVGKTILNNYFESWKSDPETITRMLVLRYSYGKDLITDYKNIISAVRAEEVNAILANLSEGGIAEYLVKKSNVSEFVEPTVKDNETLQIVEPKPAPGTFYYPYDGSTVPFDTTVYLPHPEVVMDTISHTVCPEETAEAELILPEENENNQSEENQETNER